MHIHQITSFPLTFPPHSLYAQDLARATLSLYPAMASTYKLCKSSHYTNTS